MKSRKWIPYALIAVIILLTNVQTSFNVTLSESESSLVQLFEMPVVESNMTRPTRGSQHSQQKTPVEVQQKKFDENRGERSTATEPEPVAAVDKHAQYEYRYTGIDANVRFLKPKSKIRQSGTVFVCGWDRGRLREQLFPEFTSEKRMDWKQKGADESSFLFFGLCGPCPAKIGKSKLNAEWLQQNFKGTTLMVNGEGKYAEDSTEFGMYQIGRIPDSERSVHTLFGPMAFIGHYPMEWRKELFDHNYKPKSQKNQFLIYMNANCVPHREDAVDRIGQHTGLTVHAGGACKGTNNTAYRIPKHKTKIREAAKEVPWSHNRQVFNQYRFCLVMENEALFGYITEKLINAFLGGCIPIYYATEEVFNVFNRDAFIFYNVSDPEPALRRIKYLENNRDAYDQVLQGQPILANGNQTIRDYFSFADDVGGGFLKKKIRSMLGFDDEDGK